MFFGKDNDGNSSILFSFYWLYYVFHDLLTKYLQQIDVLIITNWRHFRVLELRKLFCITFYEVTCLPACLPLCMYANICSNKEDRFNSRFQAKRCDNGSNGVKSIFL
jgi:hypothetical protein